LVFLGAIQGRGAGQIRLKFKNNMQDINKKG
jgi:hypothetical protein